MANRYSSIMEVESIEFGPVITSVSRDARVFWTRVLTIKDRERFIEEITLFTNVGPEALMAPEEKAHLVNEDGFGDLRLQKFTHALPQEPALSGIARIAE